MPDSNLTDLEKDIARHYYTAKQAQKKLGMNKDKFNYTMKMRRIKSVPFLGGYGFYKKSEIDSLSDEIEEFLLSGTPDLRYRTATLEDLDDEIELAALNFGRKRAEATREYRVQFLQTNPEMTHLLFNDDSLLASINLIPFTHDAILEFREGKRGWLLGTERIEQFEPGHRLECVIIDMMTTTKITWERRKLYAFYLMRRMAEITLPEWGKRGIDIITIDACAGTDDGERILKTARFEYLGKRDERDIYHLDLDKASLTLLSNYREALNNWKSQ